LLGGEELLAFALFWAVAMDLAGDVVGVKKMEDVGIEGERQ
jgi:hypothetical protein